MAPHNVMALADAINVIEDVIILSCFFQFKALPAINKPAVPLDTTVQYLELKKF